MTRVRNFLLCLVLLALAGILHHEWTQMTGSSGIEPEVRAAILSNGAAQSCNGGGTWHFVNPQAGGSCPPLTVLFTCEGVQGFVTKTATVKQCNTNTTNYNNISTTGNCTLASAYNDAPGKIVLSDYHCTVATPTPTPTPTPSPSPSPSPTA